MSWMTVIWSMNAGACLALGFIYLIAWLKDATKRAHLAFAVMAASVAAIAMCELLLMHAGSPAEFGEILRWAHLPVFFLTVSIVAFLRCHFGSGHQWLAWSVIGLRLLALTLNFLVDPNINYQTISHLDHVETLNGETVAIAIGTPHPLDLVAKASNGLLLIFIADASIACWRRGGAVERRRARVIGGSFLFMIAVAGASTFLLQHGVIRSVYWVSLPFLAVLVTIGLELGTDIVRAARLAEHLQMSEADLRESERRREQAAEAANLANWEWDVDRDEILMAGRGRVMFGLSATERIDFQRLLGTMHPDDRDTVQASVMKSLKVGGRYEREYRVVLPNGQLRWIATRGRVEMGPGNKAARVRGISFDISQRKHAEESFRQVVETSPSGMIIADSEGLIIFANARVLTDFGYAHDELIGQPIEVLIPERFRSRHSVDLAAFLTGPASRAMAGREVAGRHRSGREIPLEVALDTIHTPAGPGVLATITNVSERKQRDKLLWKERAFLWQVIDINPSLIFAKDTEGRFTLANQAVADIYGTTVRALIGKTDADFNRKTEEVEAFRRADREVMASLQDRFIPEEQITDAAGKRHWLQTVKRPILDSDGRATQILGVSTDITARKQTDLELDRQRNELAHLARVTMLSELSGSLAHELNQPLAAILSNAQAALRFMAHDDPDLDEVRDILSDIVNDDRRAGEIIRGLRLLLKKGELRYEPVHVNEVVADVLRLTRSDMLNAGVDLSTTLAPSLPTVRADRVQLQQVLLNLVVNGCDAMSGVATGRRQLRVSSDTDDGGCVRVDVSDHGRGIAKADLERVFEPFFTTKAEGLGLGLSVCRKIIESHGGRLWATSNPDGGASFHFTIPVTPGDRQ